jgi:drug/metabolite transporter (DMT)-like permease
MPKLTSNTKGYLFALLATVSFSNVYIFSKAALNEISLAKFWFYWFAIGFVLNLAYSVYNRAFKALRNSDLKIYRSFLLLGFLEILTEATFFIAINTIPNPAVTSFLGNLYMVFLILLGVIMLRERFSRNETIGAAITLTGTFMVGYNAGSSFSDFFIPGTGIVVVNAFVAAYTSIVAKKTIHKLNPALVNLNRSLFLLVAAAIYFFVKKEDFSITPTVAFHVFAGALLGPFLSILAIYYAFKHLEASRVSVIMGLKGVFVLLGTILYFHAIPISLQFWGGIISVFGVLFMAFRKSRRMNEKPQNVQS